MNRLLHIILTFLAVYVYVDCNAQIVRNISHASGTVTYGSTAVTVAQGPHSWIQQTYVGCNSPHSSYEYNENVNWNNKYSFYLSRPVKQVGFNIRLAVPGDSFLFRINNQQYVLNYSNFSQYSVTNTVCHNCMNNVWGISASGKLVDTAYIIQYIPTTQTLSISCTGIQILHPQIDSFSVEAFRGTLTGQLSGGRIDVWFLEDTTSFVAQPFNDTLFCPDDSLYLPYVTSFNFQSGNSFTAQLSDANGSFASPVNIGSISAVTKDTIPCRIPANTPAGSGYRIRLVSTAPQDTSLDNYADIRVKAGPVSFSNTTNPNVCSGDTLYLKGSSTTSGLTWTWTGPNSFSSMMKDTFIANAGSTHAGAYAVKAQLGSTGCALTETITVNVKTTPAAPVAGSNGPVCEGGSLQLNTSSTTGSVTYSWKGPGGYSSNTQNPVVTTNAALTHAGDYISTATLNGCPARDTVTVIVFTEPARPTASAANSPLCARQDLQLNATTVSGADYRWYGPAGYTAQVQNPVRTYTQLNHAGKYYVYAVRNGCISDTDSVTVVVNTDPIVNVFPTPGTTICAGQQAVFTAIPTNGGTVGYQWFVNNVATGVLTPSYSISTLNNGDVVYCLMSSTGTCATTFIDTSNVLTMIVNPQLAPKVTMSADAGPSLFPNEPITFTAVATDAGNAPEYQWLRNNQPVGGATGATWGANANFLSNDDICVRVKSNYECASPDFATSNCIKLNIRVSVQNVGELNGVKVYPNPVSNQLTVDSKQLTIKSVELYDVVGRVVAVPQVNSGSKIQLDMSAVPAGNYVLQVIGDDGGRGYYKIQKGNPK